MPDLAGSAAAVAADITDDEALRWLDAGLGRLRERLAVTVPAPLLDWAEQLAGSGDAPLLGLGRRAGRYEALQWNAARHPTDPLLVTALLAADPGTGSARLGRAVAAGEAVLAAVRAAGQSGPAVADPTVLGCAVVATLVAAPTTTEPAADRLREVLDVAASLMVLSATGGPDGADRVRLMRAGHGAAAGWLASRAVAAGLVGMPHATVATLATVAGTPARGTSTDAVGGPRRRAGDLLAELS